MNNLVIFDLDGVITSEEAYWDAAGLTLHELLYSPRYWNLDKSQLGTDGQYHPATTAQEGRRISRAVFPESEILTLKARAINSNWDTCYASVCLHLIDLLSLLPDCSALLPFRPWDASWNALFRGQFATVGGEEDPGGAGPHRGRPQGTLLANDTATAGELPSMTGERSDATSVGARFIAPQGCAELGGATSPVVSVFDDPIFYGSIGLELINRFDAFASEVLGYPIEGVFSRHSPFWPFCRNIFQEWYLGDALYTETYGHSPAQPGKPGCIHFELPLLPLEEIRGTLESLRKQGYIMGFATGRVWQEAVYPLKMYDLLDYFDKQHISTYDAVERAEAELRAHGDRTLLSKPHPFPFLIAANRDYTETRNKPTCFVVVGDSTSDILGGRAAGALTVAVLTGARTPEARAMLTQSKPDFTIDDMTKLLALLAHIDSLATIQHLQFTEREKAERLLQCWFERHMNLATESVTLVPRAVSLNSFNGFYHSDGEEYFFKTHIEEQGILEEYYHAEQLHRAGYNIVRPLRTMHEEGQQMVIYPVVRWPVMFDLMRATEIGDAEDGTSEVLVLAEKQECGRLLDIYRSTFASSTAEEHALAPIHQLFWHRLAGGRFKSFYDGKLVPLPNSESTWECRGRSPLPGFAGLRPQVPPKNSLSLFSPPQAVSQRGQKKRKTPFKKKVSGREETSISFDELLKYHWIINGDLQQRTLGELVEHARVVLNPARAALTIIGHGDAHFGNVFLENAPQQVEVPQTGQPQGSPLHFIREQAGQPYAGPRYLYFDPAFAGQHTPLLDVIKPLFHNVFATWMYFPQEIAQSLELTVSRHDMTTIAIEHNYTLTPIRQAILQTKVEHLLRPLIAELRARDALPADWEEIMQLALMCCALLTINLLDRERMPPSIAWLGLLLAVQTGNSGIQPWGTDI